jgi:hypothetical protein
MSPMEREIERERERNKKEGERKTIGKKAKCVTPVRVLRDSCGTTLKKLKIGGKKSNRDKGENTE